MLGFIFPQLFVIHMYFSYDYRLSKFCQQTQKSSLLALVYVLIGANSIDASILEALPNLEALIQTMMPSSLL